MDFERLLSRNKEERQEGACERKADGEASKAVLTRWRFWKNKSRCYLQCVRVGSKDNNFQMACGAHRPFDLFSRRMLGHVETTISKLSWDELHVLKNYHGYLGNQPQVNSDGAVRWRRGCHCEECMLEDNSTVKNATGAPKLRARSERAARSRIELDTRGPRGGILIRDPVTVQAMHRNGKQLSKCPGSLSECISRVVRVGGRLENPDLPKPRRRLVILPGNHEQTSYDLPLGTAARWGRSNTGCAESATEF
ncbi:Protein IQ-DOMAIN [Trichinella pseudospiralis]